MNRILISNGAFSSLVLASVLVCKNKEADKNFFLAYFKNSSKKKSEAIFNLFNYLIPTEKNLNFFDYKTFYNFNFKKLFLDIKCKDINEVYIPINSRTKQIYKYFSNNYKVANFIFYEEGLMSYVKPLLDFSLRKIMKKTENYYIFYNEKLKNLLVKSFTSIKFKTIEKSFIINNIKIIQNFLPPLVNLPINNKYALVLPQYYYQNNTKKTNKIIELYYNNIKNLIDNNYKIIFKDHPKAKLKYSDKLKSMFNEEDFILFDDIYSKKYKEEKNSLNKGLVNNMDSSVISILPVEVLANKIKIDLVFSVYSTSLYTFKYLFNITSCTSKEMLKGRMSLFSLYPLLSAVLVSNTIDNNIPNNKDILYTDNKLVKILILVLKLIHRYKN